MEDIELVKSELAMYGVKVTGHHAVTYRGGKEVSVTVPEMVGLLRKSVKRHKDMFFSLWSELVGEFKAFKRGVTAANESTQRMFSNAVKRLYSYTRNVGVLKEHAHLMKTVLSYDVTDFGEAFMSKVTDLSLGISWVDHLVRADLYTISLLKFYARRSGIKVALYSDDISTDVSGVQGPWSNLDIPKSWRVWKYDEEEETLEGNVEDRQNSSRYQLPETYNTPDEFEEGFYWRELRNDPYAFDDKDNDPYPHDNRFYKRH